MIIKFKLFEKLKKVTAKNPASWKGTPFWIGVIDNRDYQIVATWTYERAESCDFHHSFYMDIEYQNLISDEIYTIFFFNGDDVEIDNRGILSREEEIKISESIWKQVDPVIYDFKNKG